MDIAVSNFKRIRTAEVTIEGLTLLVGFSGRGKSTLIKGLKAVLSNQTTDRQYRYGTNGFRYGIKLDGHELVYSREKGTRRVEYTAPGATTAEALTKLDRDSLAEIVPAFPLKQIKVKGSSFFPNVVSQGQLPLFSQIDPTDLFALLYEDVAKVTTRLDRLKKELLASNKGVSELEAQIRLMEQNELALSEEFAKLDLPAIEKYGPFLDVFFSTKRELQLAHAQFSQDSLAVVAFGDILTLETLAPELVASPERYRKFTQADSLIQRMAQSQQAVWAFDTQSQALLVNAPSPEDVVAVASRLSQAKPLLLSLEASQATLERFPALPQVQELPEDILKAIPATLARLKQAAPLLVKFASLQIDTASLLAKIHQLAGVEEALDRLALVLNYFQAEAEVDTLEASISGVVSSITTTLSELSSFDHCPLCGAEADLKKVFTHVH